MSLPPIIERELRIAVRKHNPRKSRIRITWIALALTTLGALLQSFWLLHIVLFLLAVVLAIAKTIDLTFNLISEERRNQTLGLLFLAGLSPGEAHNEMVTPLRIVDRPIQENLERLECPFKLSAP